LFSSATLDGDSGIRDSPVPTILLSPHNADLLPPAFIER
jgi:hypothetical protein